MFEMPGYNLKNCVAFPITVDAEDGYISYGAPIEIPYARKLSRGGEMKKGEFWGDGKLLVRKKKRGPATLDMEFAGLDMDTEAAIFGETKDATSGIVTEGEDDQAPLYAFGYVDELADETEKVFIELWGSFEPTSEEYETYQGEIAMRARTVRFDGQPRPCDKKNRIKASESHLPDGVDLDEFFTAATLMATLPAEYVAPAG